MTGARPPYPHIVRVRQPQDLTFARRGLMDELLINANELEHSPDSTQTALRRTRLPYTVDPVLWRFQRPEWWRNENGAPKKNFARLGAAYVEGTDIDLGAGPLLQVVPGDAAWRAVAGNIIQYQCSRLAAAPTLFDLLDDSGPRELRPVRCMAPALIPSVGADDRINRLLAEASIAVAAPDGLPLALPVIVPLTRLLSRRKLANLLATIPTEGIGAYFVWTPNVSEQLLLADDDIFMAVLRLISSLAERGIPVGHLHATYAIAAFHDLGVSAVVHSLGWVDKGEPADQARGGLRSCRTYVPGIRHSVLFERAQALGRALDAAGYGERYCDCAFCTGVFERGEHPLDLLLESQPVRFADGRERDTPTGRAVTANTWHFLLARGQEVQAFAAHPAVYVLARDIDRAAALAGEPDSERLRRLAGHLRSA